MNARLNGKYKATLFDATRYVNHDGKDAILFAWRVTGTGERATSTLTLTDSSGGRNNGGINGTRKWCPGWDGTDLGWFVTNLEKCRDAKAVLQFDNGNVLWVYPDDDSQPVQPGGTIVKLIVSPSSIVKAPSDVSPNFHNAKALFDIFTEGTEKEDANYIWTRLAAKVGPMQIDFTSEDWQKMINMIRLLKSKTIVIPKETK